MTTGFTASNAVVLTVERRPGDVEVVIDGYTVRFMPDEFTALMEYARRETAA